MLKTILFLQTGGTIDKVYPQGDNNHGYNFEIKSPAYKSILERAKVEFNWSHLPLLKKDSLDMVIEDRKYVRDTISRSKYDMVIITHGTDTIAETAKCLLNIRGKVIILVGSMQPAMARDTDADFNLGMAVGAIQYLKNGVYIALHGEVVSFDKFKSW